MSNTIRMHLPAGTANVLVAPRQFWLATLGAAAVTRVWAAREAGTMFRALVKEGTRVESQALRVAGQRVDASITRASALARNARMGLRASVLSMAKNAAQLRGALPAVHARIAVDAVPSKPPRTTKASGTRKPRKTMRKVGARTKR